MSAYIVTVPSQLVSLLACVAVGGVTLWATKLAARPFRRWMWRRFARDIAATQAYHVPDDALTHRCPQGAEAVMPCCGRSPFEVPFDERITLDDSLVTCGVTA